jgi:hypothetical protein
MLVTMRPLRASPNGGGRGCCAAGSIGADDDAASLDDAAVDSTMALELVAATPAEAAGASALDEGSGGDAAQAPTEHATRRATLALTTTEA